MNTSDQTDKIFPAIVKAQAEMPAVRKSATNPFFKCKYAPLDSVVKAAAPILKDNGLAVVQGGRETGNGKVIITTRIIHTSGQWIESELEMTPEKNTPQGVGACLTYASRYGYRMLGVVTDEDDDGNSVSQKEPLKEPEEKAPEAQPDERSSAGDRDKFLKAIEETSALKHLENWYKKHRNEVMALMEGHKDEVIRAVEAKKNDFKLSEGE